MAIWPRPLRRVYPYCERRQGTPTDGPADVYASSQHPPGLAKTQTTSPRTALFCCYLARWSACWVPHPSDCLRGGGNCTTRGCNTPATRRQRASCRAKPPHRPRHRAARISTVKLRHQRTVTSHGPFPRQTITLHAQICMHKKPPVSWRCPRNGRLSMKDEAEASERCVSAWLDAMRQPHQRRRPEPRRLPHPPTPRTHRSQRGHQHAPESGWKHSGLQGWTPASDRRSG